MLSIIPNNLIKRQSLVYTQLNDQSFLFLTIHFDIRHFYTKFKREVFLFDPWI